MRRYLTARVTALREAYGFWRWQRATWRAHQEDAATRYCTEQLRQRLVAAEGDLEQEDETLFGEPLAHLEGARAGQAATVGEIERRLSILKCDYGSKLGIAYRDIKEINRALSDAYDRLNDAKSDAKSERAYLRHWYDRAESRLPIYGKTGRPVPRHSLFGMSTAKRDRAKAQLANAEQRATDCWLEVKALRARRDRKRKEIGKLKRDRDERNSLRRNGASVVSLSRSAAFATADLTKIVRKISALTEERKHFRLASAYAKAAAALELQIMAIESEHQTSLEEFWSEGARKARRTMFDATRGPKVGAP